MKLENQIETIKELKENKDMIGQEQPIETLLLAPDRYQLENEANVKLDPISLKEVFKKLDKEEEIGYIVKSIVP